MFYTKYTAKEIMNLQEAEILEELNTLKIDYKKEHQLNQKHTIFIKRRFEKWKRLCLVDSGGNIIKKYSNGYITIGDVIDFKKRLHIFDYGQCFISKSQAKSGFVNSLDMNKGIITLEFDDSGKMYRFMNTVINSPESDSLDFGTSIHINNEYLLKRSGIANLESTNLTKKIPAPIQIPATIKKQKTVISSNSTEILVEETDLESLQDHDIRHLHKKQKI